MVLECITEEIVNGIIQQHGISEELLLSSNGIRFVKSGLGQLNGQLLKLDLSYNAIENIEGLQSLTLLKELNLSGNCLESAEYIQHMSRLQHLDISQNNIANLSSIQMLDGLSQLESLNIAGNPICSSALVYPCLILTALPSLKVLDGRSREEHISRVVSDSQCPHPQVTTPATAAPPDPSAKTPLSSSSASASASASATSVPTSHLSSQLALAQAETAAYADMFRFAEASLSVEAPKSVFHSSRASRPDMSAILSYPYQDLLKLWRQRVHSLTLQSILDKTEKKSLQNTIDKLRLTTAEEHKSLSQTKNSFHARLETADQLIEAQKEELARVQSALEESTKKQAEMKRREEQHKREEAVMRKFLVSFRAEVDKEVVASRLLELKLQRRLASFAVRFKACQDRLQLLGILADQKEVQARNNAAAFEVEKRMLAQWAREQVQRQAGGQDAEVEVPGTFSGTPTYLSISPECESVLRSVFRQLDAEDTGLVSCRLLLECLGTAAVKGLLACNHSQAGGPEVGACNTSGGRKRSDYHSAPPSDMWVKLMRGLKEAAAKISGEEDGITWGEFLLLLCPSHRSRARVSVGGHRGSDEMECSLEDEKGDDDHPSTVALSGADYRHLHRARQLGDLEWAMVPLSLSPSALEAADESALVPTSWLKTVVNGKSVEFDVSRLKREALRLAKERAFLLGRVQAMSGSLERRAASIKSYFSNDLRKLMLKTESTQQSLRDKSIYAGELEERVQTLSARIQQEQRHRAEQQETLTAQLVELQTNLAAASSREETTTLEKMLEEYRDRANQTESELRIVRKELDRAAHAHKSLQRDLRRHQATESAACDLAEDYKVKYKDQKQAASLLQQEQEAMALRLATSEKALEAVTVLQKERAEAEKSGKEAAVQCDEWRQKSGDTNDQTLELSACAEPHGPASDDVSSAPLQGMPSADNLRTHQSPPREHNHDHDYERARKSLQSRYPEPHPARGHTPPPLSATVPQQAPVASGIALENMMRKLRMMAESLDD